MQLQNNAALHKIYELVNNELSGFRKYAEIIVTKKWIQVQFLLHARQNLQNFYLRNRFQIWRLTLSKFKRIYFYLIYFYSP